MASRSALRHQLTPAAAVIRHGARDPRLQHMASRRRRQAPATMPGAQRRRHTTRLPLVVLVPRPPAQRSTLPRLVHSTRPRRVHSMPRPLRPGRAAGAPTLHPLLPPGRRHRGPAEGTTARLRRWLTVALRRRRRAARDIRTMIEPFIGDAGRHGWYDRKEVDFSYSAEAFRGGLVSVKKAAWCHLGQGRLVREKRPRAQKCDRAGPYIAW